MKLKATSKQSSTNIAAHDLSLIISEFSRTISKYECESVIPITMWVEIEESKNDLIRLISIINDEGVDLSLFDKNYDINSVIWGGNDSLPYETTFAETPTRRKSNNCNFCNPIKINFSAKLNKPEIKIKLRKSINFSNLLFQSNTQVVCNTALVMSQGCIPDLVRIIGMLLMALSTIISSVNLESVSLSSFISGSLGAVLNIALKKGMFVVNASVSKSECLSEMIKEIMSYLPTSQSLNNRLDPEMLKMFGLYNKNPTDLNKLYDNIDNSLTRYGKDGIDTLFDGLDHITQVIDFSMEKVNDWLDGLFNLSNYITCERERSNTDTGEIVERIMEIISMINTIRAIIDRKYKKKNCESPTGETQDGSEINLTEEEIAEVISQIIDIQEIIKNEDGKTIGIILPAYELRTVYLDTFGCNLPTFMDFLIDSIPGSLVAPDIKTTDSFNSKPGRFEQDYNNPISNSVFNVSSPNFVPASNFNSITPMVMSQIEIGGLDKENFIDIETSLSIITTLMKPSVENNFDTQGIINNVEAEKDTGSITNKENDDVVIPTIKPASNENNSIEYLMTELKELGFDIVDIDKITECK